MNERKLECLHPKVNTFSILDLLPKPELPLNKQVLTVLWKNTRRVGFVLFCRKHMNNPISLGSVAQKLITPNLGLKVNQGFCFSCYERPLCHKVGKLVTVYYIIRQKSIYYVTIGQKCLVIGAPKC